MSHLTASPSTLTTDHFGLPLNSPNENLISTPNPPTPSLSPYPSLPVLHSLSLPSHPLSIYLSSTPPLFLSYLFLSNSPLCWCLLPFSHLSQPIHTLPFFVFMILFLSHHHDTFTPLPHTLPFSSRCENEAGGSCRAVPPLDWFVRGGLNQRREGDIGLKLNCRSHHREAAVRRWWRRWRSCWRRERRRGGQ